LALSPQKERPRQNALMIVTTFCASPLLTLALALWTCASIGPTAVSKMVIRRVLIDLAAADWGAPWSKSVGWGRRPTRCDGPFLFLRRAHLDGSHRGLCLSTGFVNCISSQCYRSYVRDQGLIDNSTFLCRAIMHDIKFCGPNRRRNKRDYDCYQGHFHCKQPRSRCYAYATIYNVRFTPENDMLTR
jgi:hypothetical protein